MKSLLADCLWSTLRWQRRSSRESCTVQIAASQDVDALGPEKRAGWISPAVAFGDVHQEASSPGDANIEKALLSFDVLRLEMRERSRPEPDQGDRGVLPPLGV